MRTEEFLNVRRVAMRTGHRFPIPYQLLEIGSAGGTSELEDRHRNNSVNATRQG